MANLREKTPMEFTDDGRWGRYFTNLHVVVMVVLAIISLLYCSIMKMLGLLTWGVLSAIAFDILVMGLVMLPYHNVDNLFYPSGTMMIIMIRYYFKKSKKIIYVKRMRKQVSE